jgi:hypothetical protein
MSAHVDLEEYAICRRRGHTPSDTRHVQGDGNKAWERCRWCGIVYYFEPRKLVEVNPPPSTS